MKNNFGIYENSFSEIIKALNKFPELEKAVIFGSRAMKNYKKGSDIDIALFGEKITYELLVNISYNINEELPVPYFVDILHFDTLNNNELKKQISEKGVIIYQK